MLVRACNLVRLIGLLQRAEKDCFGEIFVLHRVNNVCKDTSYLLRMLRSTNES